MLIIMLESLQLVHLAGRVRQMLIALLESPLPAVGVTGSHSQQMLIALLEHLTSVLTSEMVFKQPQHAGVNRQKLICIFSVMHCSKSSS